MFAVFTPVHPTQSPLQQQYHARLQLTMTAASQPNSSACVAAGVCKALGGYSVWAALPPLPQQPPSGAAAGDSKPIILVVAHMDSMDMIHDAVQVGGPGAESKTGLTGA